MLILCRWGEREMDALERTHEIISELRTHKAILKGENEQLKKEVERLRAELREKLEQDNE